MTKGRTVKMTGEPLELSSGITVYVRKVSPYTRQAIAKSIPKPAPPMATVDYGDGKTREEPNEADPQYQAQLNEWQAAVSARSQDVILRLGVQAEIDPEAVAERRAEMDALGLPSDTDDHLFYLKHVAIESDADLTAITDAVLSKSQPTPQAVAQHQETFRGNIQGEVDS